MQTQIYAAFFLAGLVIYLIKSNSTSGRIYQGVFLWCVAIILQDWNSAYFISGL